MIIFKPSMIIRQLITIIILFTLNAAFCQEAIKPRPSPFAVTSIRYKDAYIKITYSQPHKRNREVFGTLVPHGQVWRTGANEATEITATHDILLNNQTLKAGTYSIFTIPDKEKWTIIINSEVGLWGSYNYNSKLDVMRFDVPVHAVTPSYEPFTLQFDQRNEMADLLILWDKTKLTIPIKFIN